MSSLHKLSEGSRLLIILVIQTTIEKHISIPVEKYEVEV